MTAKGMIMTKEKVANQFWANCLTLISRVQCLGLNQSSAVLRVKSVERSA